MAVAEQISSSFWIGLAGGTAALFAITLLLVSGVATLALSPMLFVFEIHDRVSEIGYRLRSYACFEFGTNSRSRDR